MAGVASKNPFDILGNDEDGDSSPAPPTKAIDKNAPRQGKRTTAEETPRGSSGTSTRGGRTGGRGRGVSGNEAAFRDRGAGHDQNRKRDTDEREGGNRGRGRGGSRGRGGPRDDRHSKTGVSDHEKQVGHGWGANTGEAELNDEQAGEAIAKKDEKEADGDPSFVDANGEDEDEVKTKSYDDYLAEIAQKKLQVSEDQRVRKPNEGSSKKFPEGKPVSREEEEQAYFVGSGGKAKRERAKKEKNVLELDGDLMRQTENERRGGRGGGRGGRGGDRGDRPDRGDFGGRGRGRGGRGDSRGGDRGRGDRGDRGDRGGPRRAGPRGGAPNVTDTSAFPSLGA